jgi:hypothetical protein
LLFFQRNERPGVDIDRFNASAEAEGILEPCNTQPFGTLCPSGWLPESSAASVHVLRAITSKLTVVPEHMQKR